MSFLSNLLLSFSLFSSLLFTFTHAATFEFQFECPYTNWAPILDGATFKIRNQCPYTVWAAAIPGGGQLLNNGESWTININAGTTQSRIWGRTNCTFDGSGRGDCNGLLECQGYGQPPNTVAEYDQFENIDYFHISLVDGFNIPMDFSGCSSIKCTADINGQCPNELRAPGGCNNPCTVFKTDRYCCNSENCGPTSFSRFFKQRCPDAYTYPKDYATSTVVCPSGTNYKVVFCP